MPVPFAWCIDDRMYYVSLLCILLMCQIKRQNELETSIKTQYVSCWSLSSEPGITPTREFAQLQWCIDNTKYCVSVLCILLFHQIEKRNA